MTGNNSNATEKKRKILFLCVGNAFRSIVAEAYAKKYIKGFEVESAGVRPLGYITPEVIQILKEDGLDTSELKSKALNTSQIPNYEYVVVLARIPFIAPPEVKIIFKEFEDPGQSLDSLRKIKDEIKNFIIELSKLLCPPPSSPQDKFHP